MVPLITGTAGAELSTVCVLEADTFPVASSWVAVNTVLSLTAGLGVIVQFPFVSTTAVPMVFPSASLTVTVDPTSPVPVIVVPLLSLITGTAGAV